MTTQQQQLALREKQALTVNGQEFIGEQEIRESAAFQGHTYLVVFPVDFGKILLDTARNVLAENVNNRAPVKLEQFRIRFISDTFMFMPGQKPDLELLIVDPVRQRYMQTQVMRWFDTNGDDHFTIDINRFASGVQTDGLWTPAGSAA